MASGDGGPAFPSTCHGCLTESHEPSRCDFPHGLSLRDWFAGRALEGMLIHLESATIPAVADAAYTFADAMLRAREQPPRTRMLLEILYEACKADREERSGDSGATLEKAWPLVCEALGRPTK